MNKAKRIPSLWIALMPIIFLIALLALNVYYFGDDTLSGANQIALMLAAGVAGIISTRLGANWEYIRHRIVQSISNAMPAMLILLLIGSLAGTWLLSGVVPAMIYYGLQVLNPTIFLFAAVIVSALVSLATGSSWSTIATIGVALLGIGKALGMSEAIVAGAIISGAYFGDKMSPLSDTTNLAPAMAGTDLFTHIRYMVYTTSPSLILTLVIFLIMGFTMKSDLDIDNVNLVSEAIQNQFFIHPVLFLVPIILITIIIKKVPPIPSLLIGTLLGGLFAVIFQPHVVREIASNGESYFSQSYIAVLKATFGHIHVETEQQCISDLFTTTGMGGMLPTIWLILSAMVFGGVMESGGLLKRISRAIISMAKNTGSLVTSTVGTCIFFNITASDQYIAIVVPGRMYKNTYQERNLKPEVLSRTLEDAGTVTSVLIPWNTGGATQAKVLGVPTLEYLPYCFFNIISPFMSILFAYLNIKIRKIKND
jgi:NhaC family Na+:H+ antiporter